MQTVVNRVAPHLNGKATAPYPNGTNGTQPAAKPKKAKKRKAKKRDGRDQSGRFTKGNQVAVGHINPVARRRAELHTAMIGAMSGEQMQQLAATLFMRALGGDMTAAELLLRYV